MSYIKGYDPDTLREIVDPMTCRERLDELDEQRSLPALLERVWLLKVLGSLDDALALASESVRVARMAGTRKDLVRSRVLRATVLQHRGDHDAAAAELETCAFQAEGAGWTSLAAFAREHQGKNLYEAGDFDAAREAFKTALFHRHEAGADPRRIEAALLAIDAAERRQSERALA